MPGYAVKIAEFTVRHADIGGVAVAVDDPGDHIARHQFQAQPVRGSHQDAQGGIPVEKCPFPDAQELPLKGFFDQAVNGHGAKVIGYIVIRNNSLSLQRADYEFWKGTKSSLLHLY